MTHSTPSTCFTPSPQSKRWLLSVCFSSLAHELLASTSVSSKHNLSVLSPCTELLRLLNMDLSTLLPAILSSSSLEETSDNKWVPREMDAQFGVCLYLLYACDEEEKKCVLAATPRTEFLQAVLSLLHMDVHRILFTVTHLIQLLSLCRSPSHVDLFNEGTIEGVTRSAVLAHQVDRCHPDSTLSVFGDEIISSIGAPSTAPPSERWAIGSATLSHSFAGSVEGGVAVLESACLSALNKELSVPHAPPSSFEEAKASADQAPDPSVSRADEPRCSLPVFVVLVRVLKQGRLGILLSSIYLIYFSLSFCMFCSSPSHHLFSPLFFFFFPFLPFSPSFDTIAIKYMSHQTHATNRVKGLTQLVARLLQPAQSESSVPIALDEPIDSLPYSLSQKELQDRSPFLTLVISLLSFVLLKHRASFDQATLPICETVKTIHTQCTEALSSVDVSSLDPESSEAQHVMDLRRLRNACLACQM